jgi:hypothetical protein
MYVRPYVCHKMCNAPSMRDDGFSILQCRILLNVMLFALYLTLPGLFDDSNLLYSDISRGDEMRPISLQVPNLVSSWQTLCL